MVPFAPLSKIKREEETFKANRKSVISSRVVGNRLNSAGFRMYMETSRMTVDIVMLALMRMSRSSGGSGVTIAMRISNTPAGTEISAETSLEKSIPPVFAEPKRSWLAFTLCGAACWHCGRRIPETGVAIDGYLPSFPGILPKTRKTYAKTSATARYK